MSLLAVSSAVGSIRLQIEALLSTGLANSPMYGAAIHVVSGNFVTAKPYGIHDGIDFQLTGEVRSIDSTSIHQHLEHNSIVLLGPTGTPLQAKSSICWQKKSQPRQPLP